MSVPNQQVRQGASCMLEPCMPCCHALADDEVAFLGLNVDDQWYMHAGLKSAYHKAMTEAHMSATAKKVANDLLVASTQGESCQGCVTPASTFTRC